MCTPCARAPWQRRMVLRCRSSSTARSRCATRSCRRRRTRGNGSCTAKRGALPSSPAIPTAREPSRSWPDSLFHREDLVVSPRCRYWSECSMPAERIWASVNGSGALNVGTALTTEAVVSLISPDGAQPPASASRRWAVSNMISIVGVQQRVDLLMFGGSRLRSRLVVGDTAAVWRWYGIRPDMPRWAVPSPRISGSRHAVADVVDSAPRWHPGRFRTSAAAGFPRAAAA